jgi:hypothetical protein
VSTTTRDSSVAGSIEPVDERIALVTAYLAGEATPAEREEFRRRFVEDEAFAAYVAPVMAAWSTPVPYEAMRHERHRRWIVRGVGLALAAGLLLAAGVELWKRRALEHPERIEMARDAAQQLQAARDAARPPGPNPASTVPALPKPPTANSSPPTDTVTALEQLLHAVALLGTEASTGPGERKLVELPNGVRVLLRPSSTLRVISMPLPVGGIVMLDVVGEAAFEFPGAPRLTSRTTLMVSTPAGFVSALAGSVDEDGTTQLVPAVFAVRCAVGCEGAELSVGAGYVTLSRRLTGQAGTPRLEVAPGAFARVVGEGTVLVPAAEAREFPRVRMKR